MREQVREDIIDGLYSMLELNIKHPLFVWIGAASLGGMTALIDDWISINLFSPSRVYYVVLLLIGLDHVTGVAVALKRNNFLTNKFLVIIWKWLFQTSIMLIANTLSSNIVSLFWINEALLGPIVIVNLMSALKNASLLGLVNKGVTKWFYKNVDRHKNPIGGEEG